MLLPTFAQVTGALLFGAATTSASAIPVEKRTNTYLTNAHSAITTMQTFYNNPRAGFWTNGWWNSANCLELLAELREFDSSSFLTGLTDGANGIFAHTLASQNRGSTGALAWDDFYDDEMWWVLALIKVYDVTKNSTYLTVAKESFATVVSNDGESPCGGIYNAASTETTDRVASSTIATVLFVEAASLLATRVSGEKSYYIGLAETQWNWLYANIYINGIMAGDALAGSTCTNNKAYLTYIEGAAISGLTFLSVATGNTTYMSLANTIATSTMSGDFGYPIPMVHNGIITEYCDADQSCDADEAQFKGILMRGLKQLWFWDKTAVSSSIPAFLYANAQSIWANNRNSTNNLLGMAWAGPYETGDSTAIQLASHSSATMGLVMAAVVQAKA